MGDLKMTVHQMKTRETIDDERMVNRRVASEVVDLEGLIATLRIDHKRWENSKDQEVKFMILADITKYEIKLKDKQEFLQGESL